MRINKIILLIFISYASIFASQAETTMNEANQLYQSKDFEGAIQKYNEILNSGLESPAVYLNLGNSFYRSGKIGLAILNYEKGLKLDPSHEDLNKNIEIVKAHTVDRIKEVPKLFIVEWWEYIISFTTATVLQIIVLLFYLILLVSITVYFLTRSGGVQRITISSSLVGLVGAIVFSIILFVHVQRETSSDNGVVVVNTISVKQSPNESSDDFFVIHEGLKVSVEDDFGDWYKIKLSDGKVGWLPKNTLEII